MEDEGNCPICLETNAGHRHLQLAKRGSVVHDLHLACAAALAPMQQPSRTSETHRIPLAFLRFHASSVVRLGATTKQAMRAYPLSATLWRLQGFACPQPVANVLRVETRVCTKNGKRMKFGLAGITGKCIVESFDLNMPQQMVQCATSRLNY